MSRLTPYPSKDDDDTVDSDSEENLVPTKKRNSKRMNRLTMVSSKYDLDGDGVLDEAEQAMRDRDVANRGFLTNDEIYDIVEDQLRVKKSAGYMKRLIVGLTCFVCLLACSNLATSWASAILAKDLKAEEDKGANEEDVKAVPAMKIASTGEIAAAQTVGDTYEATEMTDEQLDYRRRLVLREIEEDPHSHAHRKLGKKNKCNVMDKSGCGGGASQLITFDSDVIPAAEFGVIQSKCASQRTVNIKRSWGDGGNKNSRNDCLCSRGTSLVVKEKKGKKKKGGGNDKVKVKKEKGGGKKKGKGRSVTINVVNKEFIFEKEDGKKWHADCGDDGLCYVGGTTFQGDLGDDCLRNAGQCRSGLVCEGTTNAGLRKTNKTTRYGTCVNISVKSTTVVRFAKRGALCDYNNNWDACDNGYYCQPNDVGDYWGGLAITTRSSSGGRTSRNVGDCSDPDDRACAPGYDCVSSGIPGSDRWNCIANGDRNGIILQRSVVTTTKYRGDGVGVCTKFVGIGQTCFDNYWCGNGNVCDGGVCIRRGRSGGGNVVVNKGRLYGNEDCTNDRGGCVAGYTCEPSTFNGSDRWLCT